jgi:hypothetical protein
VSVTSTHAEPSLVAPNAPPIGRDASRAAVLSDFDRKRISYLRLVLVLALVFLHYGGVYGSDISPFRGYVGQELPVASILISFILFVGFTAVPAMSAISGYLFFQGASRDVPPDFMRKIGRRATSLALPFLIWSTFFAAAAFLVHLRWPGMFANEFSTAYRGTLRIVADAVFSYSRPPVAFQLWFVHDLILTVLVSPVVWLLVGRAPWLTIAALVPLWIADFDFGIFNRLDVLVFFCFGAACALHGWRPDLPRRLILPFFGLFLLVVLARTVAPWLLGRASGLDIDIATAAMRVLGAVAVWNAAALVLSGAFADWVLRNSYMAFFIHCAHYPPILFLKLGLATMIDPTRDLDQILLYLATVGITIIGLVWLGDQLGRRWPAFFRVVSGGRVRPGAKPEASGFLPTR